MPKTKQNPIFYVLWVGVIGLLVFSVMELGKSSMVAPPVAQSDNQIAPTKAEIIKNWSDLIRTSPSGIRGNPHARFIAVEFADFQCPMCALVSEPLARAVARSKGQFAVYFYHRPFPKEHPLAVKAAEIANIAASKGKFWQTYDLFFEKQESMTKSNLLDLLSGIGMNTPDVKSELQSPVSLAGLDAQIQSNMTLDQEIHASETPTLAVRDMRTDNVAVEVGKNDVALLLEKMHLITPTEAQTIIRGDRLK